MKKLILVALAVVMVFTLVACSSFGKIESALEEIGYAEITTGDDAENAEDMKEESDVAITIHLFTNKDSLQLTEIAKLNTVFVIEFKATDEMIEYYKDSATLQGLLQDVKEDGTAEEFYNDLVEKGIANGNCLVISTNPLAAGAVKTAVKNA